jgi:hypothetical protein
MRQQIFILKPYFAAHFVAPLILLPGEAAKLATSLLTPLSIKKTFHACIF